MEFHSIMLIIIHDYIYYKFFHVFFEKTPSVAMVHSKSHLQSNPHKISQITPKEVSMWEKAT